ncbi:glycosyltransferase family 4 protein [Candidatus Enterococcus ferrettii]|uniref:Glycosyl transferase n=1 Tax=Candidatus Enterococcus ferrettii TaxID=2815324 RepID=A0ABV0EIK6_9ENTE|nr:glycosyltransferase family 4 protein [Enterococcus sp. 665A]MBO1340510.1 glycosyltransferase family 4 protein [Enterococcus sp. 665A]
MKKIIMVGPDSKGKGGISTVIHNFIHSFKQEEWQVSYVCSWKANAKLLYSLRAWCQLFFLTHTQQIEIVHIHVSQDASFYRKALLLTAIKKNAKVIFHMHAPQFDLFYQRKSTRGQNRIEKIFNRVDLVVALSEEWAQFYQQLTTTKVQVIENAVNVPEAFHYQVHSKNILTFGRICERKGSQDIVTLAKRIEKKLPDLRFSLYGDTDETTVKIIQQIKDLDCHNVELHGWTDQQEELLKDCALHLLPSYHEGVPMAILETMANGVPNLATEVGGINQVVKHQINGYLVSPGSIDEMEHYLLAFFNDPEMRCRFSNQARMMIDEHFSIPNYLQSWNRVYQSLTK